MRIAVCVGILLLNFGGFCQPILTPSSFGAEINVTLRNVYVPVEEIAPFVPTGENLLWDCSGLSIIGDVAQITSVPLSSIYTIDVPDLTSIADFAEKRETSPGQYEYLLYKVTDSNFKWVGKVLSNGDYQYQNENVLPVPFAYLQEWAYKTYDAYGTFITPNATYNDVIRIKTYYPGSPEVAPQTIYDFYTTNPFRRLFTAQYLMFAWSTKLYEYSELSVPETPVRLSISPNPTEDVVHLNLLDQTRQYYYTLYNLQGETILENVVPQSQNFEVNLLDFPSGLYLLTLKSADNTEVLLKKVVKR